MSGQVARLLLVSSDGKNIIPGSVNIPRRTYLDFLPDVFPDTKSNYACDAINSVIWALGKDSAPVAKISLDPSKRRKEFVEIKSEKVVESTKEAEVNESLASASIETSKDETLLRASDSISDIPRSTSLFKYTRGKVSASKRMDDLKVLSRSISNECDAIAVTERYILFPVHGPGK
jgi:hypothetical protein